MLHQLWLINIYFAATTITALVLSLYFYLYVRAYIRYKDKNDRYILCGVAVLAMHFIWRLVRIFLYSDVDYFPGSFQSILTLIGTVLIYIGYHRKLKIVKLPPLNSHSQRKPKGKVLSGFVPIFLFGIDILNFTVIFMIILTLWRKIKAEMSKEYKYLLGFWILFGLFLVLQSLRSLLSSQSTVLFLALKEYSILWIINYGLLIASASFLFRWLNTLLGFNLQAQIFMNFWRILVYVVLAVAAVYSVLVITLNENNTYELLTKNAGIIKNNLTAIESYNSDVVAIFSHNNDFIDAVNKKDARQIAVITNQFVNNNENLDRIVITDRLGAVIYDSNNSYRLGQSLTGNTLILRALANNSLVSGYTKSGNDPLIDKLAYQYSLPLMNSNDEQIGIISTFKIFDDNYLNTVKNATGQELIVFVDGRRASSTLISSDEISRIENLNLLKDSDSYTYIKTMANGIDCIKLNILSDSYYATIFTLNDISGKELANILVATNQQPVIDNTKLALHTTFLVSILFCLGISVPTWISTHKTSKNFEG